MKEGSKATTQQIRRSLSCARGERRSSLGASRKAGPSLSYALHAGCVRSQEMPFRGTPANGGLPEKPPRLTGYVQEIPELIHVPRPFSDGFRALSQTTREEKRNEPIYRVHLRYGSFLEPWSRV
jgi:hypothetical protein